jgi:hypothetical protein
MELTNEAMQRQVESTLWLMENRNLLKENLSKEEREYLRKSLNRLVVSCLAHERAAYKESQAERTTSA